MNVTVFGTGYVGLVQGAILSEVGHHVVCVDVDAHKVEQLKMGIIPIYDFGYENGEPFIVMPLMSGGGLDDRLEAGALVLDEIVRILDWLAPALDKVHQGGIIHRDLKPSNILFDEDHVLFRRKPNIEEYITKLELILQAYCQNFSH